jgi:transcriptional regulator with XRE-family HTH domain
MSQAESILKKLKSRGITQEQIAAALGCRQSVIAGWKRRGVIPARQQAGVLRAARELGVELSPDDFFEAPSDPITKLQPGATV